MQSNITVDISDRSSNSSFEKDQPHVAQVQKEMKRKSHYAKVSTYLDADKGRAKMSLSPQQRDKEGILFVGDDNKTALLIKR